MLPHGLFAKASPSPLPYREGAEPQWWGSRLGWVGVWVREPSRLGSWRPESAGGAGRAGLVLAGLGRRWCRNVPPAQAWDLPTTSWLWMRCLLRPEQGSLGPSEQPQGLPRSGQGQATEPTGNWSLTPEHSIPTG